MNQLSSRVTVLVPSCDKYSFLWDEFFQAFRSQWPDCPYSVCLGVNSLRPQIPGVRVLSSGEDFSYTRNLQLYLEQIETDYVLFWIDDRFLTAPVDTPGVEALVAQAFHLRLAYLKLIPEHPYFYGTQAREAGCIPRFTQYRASFTIALWDRRVLLDLVRHAQDAWQFEHWASRASNLLSQEFYGLSKAFHARAPIEHVHLIGKGLILREALPYLRQFGLQKKLSFLKVESPLQYFGRVAYGVLYSLSWRLADARLCYSHRDGPPVIH